MRFTRAALVATGALALACTEHVTTAPPRDDEPSFRRHPTTTSTSTIFSDGFESGSLGAWQDGVDPATQQVLTDAARAHAGTHVLQLTYPAGQGAGWLTRFFMPGYDSLYVSYWIRLDTTWTGSTALLALRGSRTDNQWSAFGKASSCPTGTDFFATSVVAGTSTNPLDLAFSTYYPGMPSCTGQSSAGLGTTSYASARRLSPGPWHQVAVWVKLNTVGQSDGQQVIWLDGAVAGQWTGLVYRTSTILKLNSLMLDAFAVAPQTEHAYVDDVVVLPALPAGVTLPGTPPPPPPAPVASVTVTLNAPSLTVGQSTQAVATLKDASGNVLTGRTVSWTTSNSAVATVDASGLVKTVSAGSANIIATAEGINGTAALSVTAPTPPPTVASVSVTLQSPSLIVGGSTQATATAFDGSGNVLTGQTVTWSSSNTAVSTVSSLGVVTAIGSGTAQITATTGGVTGGATVTVTVAPVASVTVTLNSPSLTTGQSTQAVAKLADASGNSLTGRAVSWSSSNIAVATIDANGLVLAVAPGTATITATSEGVSGSAPITVTVVPVASVAVTLTPNTVTVGQTAQAAAVLKDAQGNVLTGRTIAWSSSNTSIATVSATGAVQSIAAGTATITATSEGVTGSATLTVNVVPVATVSVTLNAPSLTVGQSTQAVAVTKDASGNVLTGRTITWNSSNTAVATVSSTGLVKAVAAGTATIRATSEGVTGTAPLTVTLAPVASVTLSPSTSTLVTGSTGQLTATLKDASGNVLTGRTISWASSAASVASVSTTGLVTALSVGSTTITATSEGVTGSASVSVTSSTPPGTSDMPVYDPTNPNHVIHVMEDWSAYNTSSDVGVINRADGGGPWLNGNSAYQTLSTSNVDPWFGKKTLDINYQAAPAANSAFERGLTLIQGTPARYLNAGSAKEAIVIEWAWRWEGGPYEGKIADFQPYAGTDRFNYQTDPDKLGSQTQSSCDADPLCSKYYTNNGSTPRFAGLTPQADYGTGAIARSMFASNLVFYRQNRNWAPGGTGAGSVDWGGNSWATIGITFADNRWRRTILRLTMNLNGVMGQGRIEEWMQIAGQPAVKVMEFIGDPGGFDAGLVNGRDISQGGSTWITSSATLYLYNLTAVGGIFNGGNTTHLGYVRIWSEPRQ